MLVEETFSKITKLIKDKHCYLSSKWKPAPTKLNDSEISEITTSMSVQDMIQDIMSEYRSALETLTAEVTSLRSEVADQQKQFNTKIKLLNHNQVTIKQDFEQQMTTQNKHYQQQQNQHKNQVKQQIEQLAKETVPETPKINIQYETLYCILFIVLTI